MPIHSLSPETERTGQPDAGGGLSLSTYTKWLMEIQNQPAWRRRADREMDYYDGNQLDAEILQRMREIGMPPAIEPLIGPAIDAVLGFEAKTRTDWRITAETDGGDDVAEALNFKVNQAERKSGADKACSEAFKPQIGVGIGWVEVARESDPFLFAYRCRAVHRNEIFWDMLDREPGLPKARYLLRRRWCDADMVKLKFPAYATLIDHCMGRWTDQWELSADGGTTTGLATSWEEERGWSIEEQEWRDVEMRRCCINEVWYRKWESVVVLRLPDGRVVEYDQTNAMHVIAVASGKVTPQKCVVSKMYVSFWIGPHKLHDGPTPYRHNEFPYVQFVGKIEDRTGVPYGLIKGMVFLQDNVNSAMSKIRWGLSAVRTKRTKGAVAYTDEVFRQQIARVDADIILDQEHMAQPGAVFEVERDFQLNDQQFQMMQVARDGIGRVSSVSESFKGQTGTATSGVQEHTQIEQSMQALAHMMDNFKFGRCKVGELLLSLVIEDLIGKPESVTISGNPLRDPKTVQLNVPTVDEGTGVKYLTNDVERIRMKVAMSDVPTTPSFRAQQLNAMSEAFKSMPQNFQVVALPHLLALMDVPDRDKLLEDIKNAQDQLSPEMVQKKIDEAVKLALQQSDHAIREKEIELKYNPEKLDADIRKIMSETTKNWMATFFAAMQSGEVVAAIPGVAPIADKLLAAAETAAGATSITTTGVPLGGTPATGLTVNPVKDPKTGMQFTPGDGTTVAGDTSPTTPANPASPFKGENGGMETPRTTDNQPA